MTQLNDKEIQLLRALITRGHAGKIEGTGWWTIPGLLENHLLSRDLSAQYWWTIGNELVSRKLAEKTASGRWVYLRITDYGKLALQDVWVQKELDADEDRRLFEEEFHNWLKAHGVKFGEYLGDLPDGKPGDFAAAIDLNVLKAGIITMLVRAYEGS